jgi:hypothetical protein
MDAIDSIFNRVTFDKEHRAFHYELYDKVKAIAREIDEQCPNSADKTLAFRSLHLALMHAGAALSRHEKYQEEKEKHGLEG